MNRINKGFVCHDLELKGQTLVNNEVGTFTLILWMKQTNFLNVPYKNIVEKINMWL